MEGPHEVFIDGVQQFLTPIDQNPNQDDFQHDGSWWEILGNLPFYTRAIASGLPFPKTRRIVFLEDQPATLPGWTRLELE